MFSMCSELTPRARIPDIRLPQLMQPCLGMCKKQVFFGPKHQFKPFLVYFEWVKSFLFACSQGRGGLTPPP